MARSAGMTHSEKVRLALEQDIFSGAIAPGSSLDEEELARRFEVSRTPVREAILQLIESGIVEKRPRQGAVVTMTDVTDLIRQFEVMSELESICAKYSARRMTAEERAALKDVHAQAERAFAAGDQDSYYALSRKFHLLVIDGTHNKELIDMTNKLGSKLVPYRRFQLGYPGQSQSNLEDHRAILEAILAQDIEQAAEQFRKHTKVQGDILADYIAMNEERVRAS
ncbi:GntR family transcriptional regulator [Paracoccus siganidrum]|uniref:GntR family transcriptional regulator n=1 Tax=Paracoccus siganidrum TaxID=1276757 RepID=A0A419AAT1_9RHOB|nr:GntR family transcriptional regulator [Paracoccus siganidrum]RJL20231.1 GntR family transcriptional regulator [Paracoccus siganidrum]RMC30758.1 GntR family transcriptional regulator [Paracoccus siganidrum]